MSADLIRKMQENVAKYGKQNVTTLLMMQAIRELQEANDERDRLKAANAELLAELQNIANANQKNWDAPLNDTASFQAWAQSRARAALTKNQGATA